MFKVLDEFADDFIHYAGQTDDPVLDLGSAYGVATIAALEAGGTVTACDLEQQHLDILARKNAGKPAREPDLRGGRTALCDVPRRILCGPAVFAGTAFPRWFRDRRLGPRTCTRG